MDPKPGYGYLEVDSGKDAERIFYEVHGEGVPVLFVNAPFLDRRMWELQVSGLSDKGIMAITFDFRGTGKSDISRKEYSNTSDMKRLLEHLDTGKVLIACSSGGCETALSFIDEYPGSVSGILFACPIIDAKRNIYESREPQVVEFAEQRGEVEQLMKSGKFRDAVALNVLIWGEGMEMECRERFHEIAIDNYRTLRHTDEPEIKTAELLHNLETSRIKNLLLLGNRATPILKDVANQLEQGVGDIRVLTIEDAGMFPNMEQPDRFNDELLKFSRNLK